MCQPDPDVDTAEARLLDCVLDAASRGAGRATVRGRSLAFRWGIDPERAVLHNYTETDPWLVLRRVYERGFAGGWHQTSTRWGWDEKGQWVGKGGCNVAKVGSRARLDTVVRAMCRGEAAGGGASYVEVLPWREDGVYPAPRPVGEVLAELAARNPVE